jgi:hypothetical protein
MNRRLALQALAAVIVVLAAGLLLSFYGRGKITAPLSLRNQSHGRMLATACQLYAADHSGRFPVSLTEVVPRYLPADQFDKQRYFVGKENEKAKFHADWLYYGTGFTVRNPPRVFLAAPQIIGQENSKGGSGQQEFRIYISADARAYTGREADYQRLLAATITQMRVLDDARRTTQFGPASTLPDKR